MQGGNLDAIGKIVSDRRYITFGEALVVLENSNIDSDIRGAYLDFVISAFVGNAMEESGTDIENIWRSYVSPLCVSLLCS